MSLPKIRLWHGLLLLLIVAIGGLGYRQKTLAAKPCLIGPGARCVGADLSAQDLRRANLQGADLRRARLVGTVLEDANLSGARLDEAELIGADLEQANLRGASLRKAHCLSCDLEEAQLWGADLGAADLSGADMESAGLRFAKLQKTKLLGSDLESADLQGADATGADFTGANLGRARLSAANLNGARLQAVDLASARLDRTTFVKANLSKARLGIRVVRSGEEGGVDGMASPNPCFPMPSCKPADAFSEMTRDDTGVGALLVDTDLTGADLTNADLNGVVMLRGSLQMANLEGAYTKRARLVDVPVKRTVCPDGRITNGRCTGLQIPAAGPERQGALARVAWLQSLPWPWD